MGARPRDHLIVQCIGNISIRLPGLDASDFAITSTKTEEYNCIAWALKEDDRWWSHNDLLGHYWPEGVRRAGTVSAYQAALATEGFEICDSGEVVDGVEKIALFAAGDEFTHVARQLPNGRWTSKLGRDCDIEHELEALVAARSPMPSYRYGEVVAFMQRPQTEASY